MRWRVRAVPTCAPSQHMGPPSVQLAKPETRLLPMSSLSLTPVCCQVDLASLMPPPTAQLLLCPRPPQ